MEDGQLIKLKIKQGSYRRSPVVLFLLLVLWSVVIGWSLTLLTALPGQTEPATSENFKSIETDLAELTYADKLNFIQVALETEKTASTTKQNSNNEAKKSIGTVDLVPRRFQLGQQLYLENCATCHIGLPPAVLPTQTWADLLQDEQHYGKQIKPLVDPERLIVWEYLRTFSRPLNEEEQTPYRMAQSRYFRALHPLVKLPSQISMASCVSCHPGAGEYDFRRLTSEWQNAP
jgi:Dihaem cytochrome c